MDGRLLNVVLMAQTPDRTPVKPRLAARNVAVAHAELWAALWRWPVSTTCTCISCTRAWREVSAVRNQRIRVRR